MDIELRPEEAASVASYHPGEYRVLVVADNDHGRAVTCAIAARIGARTIFDGDVAGAVERLGEGLLGDAILVDLAQAADARLDLLLDRLEIISRLQRLPVIVNGAPECLDAICARLDAPSVTVMSQATAADWIAAMALRGLTPAPALHEVATDDSLRLQRLADEVDRIARTLADLAGSAPLPLRGMSDAITGFRAEPAAIRHASEASATDIRGMIRLRRMRDRYFTSDLFADPAWDMLLDLMAARLERIRVAVSSLCIAAAVPPTTALRWIRTMTDSGLFVRVADDEDGRRVFIALSDSAAAGMTAYLGAAKAHGGLAI